MHVHLPFILSTIIQLIEEPCFHLRFVTLTSTARCWLQIRKIASERRASTDEVTTVPISLRNSLLYWLAIAQLLDSYRNRRMNLEDGQTDEFNSSYAVPMRCSTSEKGVYVSAYAL